MDYIVKFIDKKFYSVEEWLDEIKSDFRFQNHEHSWIEYYMWELHFGRKWKKGIVKIKGKDFKLQTASDLWDILNVA